MKYEGTEVKINGTWLWFELSLLQFSGLVISDNNVASVETEA